jgi:DNA-binding transcriptional MerR regulator
VFISWSGDRSKKIAETLKTWIKRVIQSVEPFVSSQDISKGARWSTDVAKELQDTNFGILCVTKDNVQQPWLLFEAGALSKTLDKSFVVPLLFDLEPSDLAESPLLQFQAASFSRDEIKKLVDTLNNACENNSLETHDLDETFDVWFPKLEEQLKEISLATVTDDPPESHDKNGKNEQILEEILDLSRLNQKLLRNPDDKAIEIMSSIGEKIDYLLSRNDKLIAERKRLRSVSPMMIDEMLHMGRKVINKYYAFLIALSFFREDFPWVYDVGRELVEIIKSKKPISQKEQSIREFRDLLEFTYHSTMRNDIMDISKEGVMLLREMPMILMRYFEEFLSEQNTDMDM